MVNHARLTISNQGISEDQSFEFSRWLISISENFSFSFFLIKDQFDEINILIIPYRYDFSHVLKNFIKK